MRLDTAANLAACSIATISLDEETKRLPWMTVLKLGAASPATMASTATVTINSNSVKPAARRSVRLYRKPCVMTQYPPIFSLHPNPGLAQPPALPDEREVFRHKRLRPYHLCMMKTADSSLDALFQPRALVTSVLAGEALALILALGPAPTDGRLVLFGLASLCIQWVVLSTLFALHLLRNHLSRYPPLSIARVCLVLLLAMTMLISLVAWQLLASQVETHDAGPVDFVLRMLAMALVVGLIGLLSYQNYWRARQLAIRAKQLELESLQARIRPHFLFNTLNTGAALIHARPDAAEQVLLDLADLFRSALRSPQHVPLSEELKLTQRYLQIESLRLGDRLRLRWEVPEQLPQILAPSLSIQPLAENAIRHGIEHLVGGGQIDINVRVLDNAVEVCIANDMADDCSNSRGHSVGLASSRERVHAMTAGRGHIQGKVTGGRYIARLYLPLEPPSP